MDARAWTKIRCLFNHYSFTLHPCQISKRFYGSSLDEKWMPIFWHQNWSCQTVPNQRCGNVNVIKINEFPSSFSNRPKVISVVKSDFCDLTEVEIKCLFNHCSFTLHPCQNSKRFYESMLELGRKMNSNILASKSVSANSAKPTFVATSSNRGISNAFYKSTQGN